MSENQAPFNADGQSERPLTSAWSVHKTAEGKTYYYNKETKKSSWVIPTELDASEKKPANVVVEDPTLPAGWSAFKTPEGIASIFTFFARQNILLQF